MANVFNWSDEQLTAINHRGSAGIVTAAAGSGKTAVLVERVKRLLLGITEDKDGSTTRTDPVLADEMVITTFTKAAAAEIKARIAAALEAQAAEPGISPKDKELIADQQLRLRDAYIGTTDSLCMNFLRRYCNVAGLRPDFKVIEESQTDLLKANAMKAVMESFCEDPGDAESRELLYSWFAGENDEGIEDTVRYLYDFSRKNPDSESFFAEWLGYYKDPASYDGEVRRIYDERVQAEIVSPLEDIKANIRALVPLTKQPPTGSGARALASNPMEPVGEVWDRLLGEYEAAVFGTPDFRGKLKAANKAFLTASKTSDASGKKKIIDMNTTSKQVPSEAMSALIKQLKTDCKALAKVTSELRAFDDDMKTCAPVLEALLTLEKRFAADYAARKAKLGGLDFDDLELMMLGILREKDDSGASVPSPVAKEISDLIKIIIVDEFQDSNEVQYEIYRLISRDKKNLFFVGDIKQSIYRFRGADPLVFRRLSENDTDFTAIPLNRNFRSRETIINAANGIFEGTMTVERGDVDYNDACRLVFGAKYTPDTPDNNVEFIEVTGTDNTECRRAEAVLVANRIKQMLREGFQVSDGEGGLRPCRYKDFALIMSSYSNYARIYTNALDDAGIPYEAKDDEEYTDLEEVKYLLSLLRVIDDPYRDTDLAAVLMREPYLMSADELAQIKLSDVSSLRRGLKIRAKLDPAAAEIFDKLKALYPDGRLPDGEELAAVLSAPPFGFTEEQLGELRLYGREKHLHLWTGLNAYAENNAKAAAVLREIEEYRAFAAENSPARLIRKICDESMILPAFEAERGGLKKTVNLRLMPHYAENFPGGESAGLYDFLRYLETLERRKIKLTKAEGDSRVTDAVRIMTVHGSKGLEFPVCFMVNLSTMTKSRRENNNVICDPRYGIGMCVRDGDRLIKTDNFLNSFLTEENKRLALSESMRLLYVAVTRAREKLIITVPNPPKTLNESHWGWISTCAAVENGLIVPASVGAADVTADEYSPDDDGEIPAGADSAGIDLASDYKFRDLTRVPAKFTATQLGVKNDPEYVRSDDPDSLMLRMPSFLSDAKDSGLRGRKRGDAYHKVMELLDFSTDPADVTAVLNEFREKGLISQEERDCIDDNDIVHFLGSKICQRALKCGAVNIYKEHPLFYEAGDKEIAAICEQYGISEWDEGYEKPFIQGIADMFFVEDGEIVLVDYKTNSKTTREKLIEEYKGQLAVYAHALEESMGMTVKEKFLYSFWLEAEGRRDGEEGRGIIAVSDVTPQ